MSVGKNSISRISTSTTTKKKTTAPAAKVEKVEEVTPVETPVETAPAKKPAAKKPAAKKPAAKKTAKASGFVIYQVLDELPVHLL